MFMSHTLKLLERITEKRVMNIVELGKIHSDLGEENLLWAMCLHYIVCKKGTGQSEKDVHMVYVGLDIWYSRVLRLFDTMAQENEKNS